MHGPDGQRRHAGAGLLPDSRRVPASAWGRSSDPWRGQQQEFCLYGLSGPVPRVFVLDRQAPRYWRETRCVVLIHQGPCSPERRRLIRNIRDSELFTSKAAAARIAWEIIAIGEGGGRGSGRADDRFDRGSGCASSGALERPLGSRQKSLGVGVVRVKVERGLGELRSLLPVPRACRFIGLAQEGVDSALDSLAGHGWPPDSAGRSKKPKG